MQIVFATMAEKGDTVQADVLALLRARFGSADVVSVEERDAKTGEGSDVLVTVRVPADHVEAAVAAIRAHDAVIDAAAGSFGERV
ncbi:hypothetical protein [Azospirillum sp. TSO22-1]|uniref:hypothetical protein n=1 Tax=Azospirillum sp. TSO22-1 TaxID=716789 RepID=UPI000D62278A|nr:hypothetical protein [Azospirillum sp. TSO22-1]PWC55946.1 hypothetical protein TSO221_03390 [Azospirillum sp. TSO22-1]